MLGRLLYYGLIKPISLLPFSALYRISDVLYLFLYYMMRYRRDIVYSNLTNSFPHKSADEILRIERLFYRHLSDVILESIKFFSITKKEARLLFKFVNYDVLSKVADSKKNIIAISSHYGNWEVGGICSDAFPDFHWTVVINKLRNGFLDEKLQSSRMKFGPHILPKTKLAQFLKSTSKKSRALVILGDQSPSSSAKVLITNFLNQDTAIATGAERIAKKYNMAVYYFHIKRVRRGQYEGSIIPVEENPLNAEKHDITRKYTRILESKILENPQYWLWSHRRWKLNARQ